jgi:hypothetical protein
MTQRRPVSELVDLAELSKDGRRPTRAELRAALPRGWRLEDDGEHARFELRLVLREGWILILGLVCFGAVGAGFVWGGLPKGFGGVLRLALGVALVLLIGGLVAPAITRALRRRS